MTLVVVPTTLAEANAFIEGHHRHHGRVVGHICSLAVAAGGEVVGVATVGRPVARGNQDGWTAEVTRCCTDGTHNACSMLYAAAWRATRALGYRKLITYTLASEGGASLRAAGWRVVGEVRGALVEHADSPSGGQDSVAGQAPVGSGGVTQPILETLGRVGGQVTDTELAYQLGETLDLEAMADLEGRGLVRSNRVFELTGRGREALGATQDDTPPASPAGRSAEVGSSQPSPGRPGAASPLGASVSASPRTPKRARKRAKTGKTRVGSTRADAS